MKIEWKQVIVAFVIGAVLASGFTCWRIHSKRGERRHHHMMEQLTKKLDLNDAQTAQVAAITENARKEITALREEGRPKFQAIKNNSRTAIRAMLTPEQATKFDTLTAEMDARAEKRKAKFEKFKN